VGPETESLLIIESYYFGFPACNMCWARVRVGGSNLKASVGSRQLRVGCVTMCCLHGVGAEPSLSRFGSSLAWQAETWFFSPNPKKKYPSACCLDITISIMCLCLWGLGSSCFYLDHNVESKSVLTQCIFNDYILVLFIPFKFKALFVLRIDSPSQNQTKEESCQQ
jgi:hypothetical protein